MSNFTIGCDPEIFLTKGDKATSAHGVIKGTKKEPFVIPDGAYQVDGMAVEFNTDPVPLANPAEGADFELFNKKVVSVMGQMENAVRATDPDLRFNIDSVQEFDEETLAAQPPEAMELGCDPDFCAYTLEENPRPEGDKVNFRTASGHIHIGWGQDIPVDHPDHLAICADFIKYMDATVGLYMTIIDADPRRRTLYGKAGAFRPKSYGVEYRTPSNLWLLSKERRNIIWTLSQQATSAAQSGYKIEQICSYSADQVRGIIDKGNYVAAYEGLKKLFTVYWGSAQVQNVIAKEYTSRKSNPLISPRPKVKAPKKKEPVTVAVNTDWAAYDSQDTTNAQWFLDAFVAPAIGQVEG